MSGLSSSIRGPLKDLNGGTSRIRPPTKVTKEDFPVQTVEDSSAQSKKRKTEAELRDDLRRRKLLNSTITSSSSTSELKRKTTSTTDLNATVDGTSRTARATVRRPVSSTLSRPTLSSQTKSAVPARSRAASTSSKDKEDASGAKKRAAWDIKGRLEDTENLLGTLRGDLTKNSSRVDQLTAQLVEREAQLSQVNNVKAHLQTDMEGHKKELQQVYMDKLELQNQMVLMQQGHNSKVQELMMKSSSLEGSLQSTISQLQMAKAENESLKMSIQAQTSQLGSLNMEMEALRATMRACESTSADRAARIEELQITLDQRDQKVVDLEAQVMEGEGLRKKLHNTIQELKGNIRVFCRVRPYVGAEKAEFGDSLDHFEFNPHNDRLIDISTAALTAGGKLDSSKVDPSKKFGFSFDKVFSHQSTQAAIFEEMSQLVQSSLDGYNTCIFAYGQTGSGKTYTMEGPGFQAELDLPIVDEECRGMIPRAVEQVYKTAELLKEKGWQYEMEATFLEIYNESLRDLLCSKQKEEKCDIKHDAKGVTTVTNITTIKVRNPSQVYELLRRAAKNRSVGETKMNERSSRSHSVFQLRLSGTNKFTNENVHGLLNLIDLAGSERLTQSGATGARLTETQHINKSLTHLGDVIAALANKAAHVPYRNSKLTYLLQNSLGGNSKTLMFVNVSPRPLDLNETISSLRFATKVNACEIGTAKKQNKVDLKL